MEYLTSFWPFLLIIGIFYFLMIRPENKKKKALTQLRNELTVGDKVVTIGGICGVICSTREDAIVIESGSDRVRIEIMRWAVSTKVNPVVAAVEEKK